MKLLLALAVVLHPAILTAACVPPPIEESAEQVKASEAAAKTSPKSDKAKLDLAKSLNETVWGLTTRKQPKDIETGILNSTRALKIAEELLKSTPPPQGASGQASYSHHNLATLLMLRGQPGDKEKAFDHQLRVLAYAEIQHKENPGSPKYASGLGQSYYKMIDQYRERDAAGDRATAYEYGVKLFKLQELGQNAEGGYRITPGRLAITAWTVAGLAEKAEKPETKQWQERAYDLFAAIEKSKEGLPSEEKSLMDELKKKLGK